MWSEPIFNHFSIYLHPSTINETHGIHPCPLYIKLFHICSMLFLYHMEVFISTYYTSHTTLWHFIFIYLCPSTTPHTSTQVLHLFFLRTHIFLCVTPFTSISFYLHLSRERDSVGVCHRVCVCIILWTTVPPL